MIAFNAAQLLGRQSNSLGGDEEQRHQSNITQTALCPFSDVLMLNLAFSIFFVHNMKDGECTDPRVIKSDR